MTGFDVVDGCAGRPAKGRRWKSVTVKECLIGMEACVTAHYWARELTKLGHKVRLMPARDVKAYVKATVVA
jgi:transposase